MNDIEFVDHLRRLKAAWLSSCRLPVEEMTAARERYQDALADGDDRLIRLAEHGAKRWERIDVAGGADG